MMRTMAILAAAGALAPSIHAAGAGLTPCWPSPRDRDELTGPAVPGADPQEEARKWGQALAFFQKFGSSNQPYERARCVKDLGDATTPKYDKQCWGLAGKMLLTELAREGTAQGPKYEEKVSGEVVESCLEALRKITDPDVVADIAKVARNVRENPRVRMYLTWALGKHGRTADLEDLVDDKSLHVQIAAGDALYEKAVRAWRERRLRVSATADRTPDFARTFVRILQEPDRAWEAKIVALRAIDLMADERITDDVITALEKSKASEGRIKNELIRILVRLVGIDIKSDDANAWRAAWALRKQGKDPGKPGDGVTVAEPIEFYGLKTRSTRLIFIIDRSGSMVAPSGDRPRPPTPAPAGPAVGTGTAKETPQETAGREEATRIRDKYQNLSVKSRMDAAKKEIVLAVYSLDPRISFNVIWFEASVVPWKQELQMATWPNKADCLREIDKVTAGGGTNIWDSLETAYKMIQQPRSETVALDKKANYVMSLNGADTIFFMTDGEPSAGRLQKGPEIVAELRKTTRVRKVIVNAICVGDVDAGKASGMTVDPKLVAAIAEETGGDFMHIKK